MTDPTINDATAQLRQFTAELRTQTAELREVLTPEWLDTLSDEQWRILRADLEQLQDVARHTATRIAEHLAEES